jgi:glutathione S-transferase
VKLIASLTSPYVRKIRILLLEKQVDFEFVNDPPWEAGSHVPDINPLGKVPALITDEGEIFFDSPIIADYLDQVSTALPRLPEDTRESIRVRQLEALADGITDAGVAWVLETRRAADKQDAGVIERQRGKIDRGLAVLSARLGQARYLYKDGFSRADIAAGCCLLWLDFRLPGYDWRASHATLAAYAAQLAARPSFAQTIPAA